MMNVILSPSATQTQEKINPPCLVTSPSKGHDIPPSPSAVHISRPLFLTGRGDTAGHYSPRTSLRSVHYKVKNRALLREWIERRDKLWEGDGGAAQSLSGAITHPAPAVPPSAPPPSKSCSYHLPVTLTPTQTRSITG